MFPVVVRVTHRFHPLFGRELEFVKRRRNWEHDMVYMIDDAGRQVAVPTSWTDVDTLDVFVEISGGSCPFRTADLLAAVDLVGRLARARADVGRSAP